MMLSSEVIYFVTVAFQHYRNEIFNFPCFILLSFFPLVPFSLFLSILKNLNLYQPLQSIRNLMQSLNQYFQNECSDAF